MRTSQRTRNSGVQFPPKSQDIGIHTSINAVADATFCRLRTSSPRQLPLCFERVTETVTIQVHCEFYYLIKLHKAALRPYGPSLPAHNTTLRARCPPGPHHAPLSRRDAAFRVWCPLAHREAQIVSWADSDSLSRHQNGCEASSASLKLGPPASSTGTSHD